MARARATNFVIDYPDDPLATEVMRLTGVHRPPKRGARRIPEESLVRRAD